MRRTLAAGFYLCSLLTLKLGRRQTRRPASVADDRTSPAVQEIEARAAELEELAVP